MEAEPEGWLPWFPASLACAMHPDKGVETRCRDRRAWPALPLGVAGLRVHVPPGRLRHGAAAGGGARRAGNLRREDGHVGAAPSAVCDIAHAQHLRTGTVLGEFWEYRGEPHTK